MWEGWRLGQGRGGGGNGEGWGGKWERDRWR